MNKIIDTESLSKEAIEQIWRLVTSTESLENIDPVAISFQGSGTRTRTTFIQALSHLGLQYIELPLFLETKERAQDLAGYLDPFYSLYVVRHNDHERMKAFSNASRRPVINAMSSLEHPCEALSDAYWFHTVVKPLDKANIVLWGPSTNVLRSWANLASTWGSSVTLIDRSLDDLPKNIDLIVTDGWPQTYEERNLHLTQSHLKQMGLPFLLPTPPFAIGQELDFDPLLYDNFAGYNQKRYLLKVQKAIIRYVIDEYTTS